MAKVQDETFLIQRCCIEKFASPFFNVMERCMVVNCETTTAAEESLRKAALASEVTLLRLAPEA